MRSKICSLLLCLVFLASCSSNNQSQNQAVDTTTHRIKLTDSSRAKLENALDDIMKSNSSPGDTTLSGRFVSQGKSDNGDFYLTIKTNDSTMTLVNLAPLKDDEITNLKKSGDNMTATFNRADKTIKFLSTQNERAK